MRSALATLVGIESGSSDGAGLERVGCALETMWRELGFAAERLPVGAAADMRRFRRRLAGHGSLLILGHLDTVWPPGTVGDWGFSADGDWLGGPGIGDMKGGLVLAHAAVRLLLERGFDGLGEVVVLLVPDEELGSVGSRAEIERQAAISDWVLVVEPARPDGSVIVGRGVVGALAVSATGVSAHVLNRQDGASAVSALAGRVAALEALSAGDNSVSVGILRGGDARQVVARACEMHVDLRAPDGGAAKALLRQVTRILQPVANERVRIDVSGGITRPAFPRSASDALFARAASIASRLGISYGGLVTRGGSDGNFTASLGRPTLDGLGPVCFETCSRRERISWQSLLQRTVVMAALIAGLPERADGPVTGAPANP